MPWGLAESDVHDVLNVFQVTGLNKDGQYFMCGIAFFNNFSSWLNISKGNLAQRNQATSLSSSRRSMSSVLCQPAQVEIFLPGAGARAEELLICWIAVGH